MVGPRAASLLSAQLLALTSCAAGSQERHDVHGYPMLEETCTYGFGETICRPATEADHLAQFGDHPERFYQNQTLEVGGISITSPSQARWVRACIGVFDRSMYRRLNEDGASAECLWLPATALDELAPEISAQLDAAGFQRDADGGVHNLQNVVRSDIWSRGCEQAAIAPVPFDRLLNRPAEPHIHVLVSVDRTECGS